MAHGIAQLCNDETMIDLHSFVDAFKAGQSEKELLRIISQSVIKYTLSAVRCNCTAISGMDPAPLVSVGDEVSIPFTVTRDIKTDEELLFHYGADYWLTQYRSSCEAVLLPPLNRYLACIGGANDTAELAIQLFILAEVPECLHLVAFSSFRAMVQAWSALDYAPHVECLSLNERRAGFFRKLPTIVKVMTAEKLRMYWRGFVVWYVVQELLRG
jgi:hypothetical protein